MRLDKLVQEALAREQPAHVQVVAGNLPIRDDSHLLREVEYLRECYALRRIVGRSLARGVRDGWAVREGRGFGTYYRRREAGMRNEVVLPTVGRGYSRTRDLLCGVRSVQRDEHDRPT